MRAFVLVGIALCMAGCIGEALGEPFGGSPAVEAADAGPRRSPGEVVARAIVLPGERGEHRWRGVGVAFIANDIPGTWEIGLEDGSIDLQSDEWLIRCGSGLASDWPGGVVDMGQPSDVKAHQSPIWPRSRFEIRTRIWQLARDGWEATYWDMGFWFEVVYLGPEEWQPTLTVRPED